MMQEVDVDGDGKINWDEFQAAMSETLPPVMKLESYKKIQSFASDPCIVKFESHDDFTSVRVDPSSAAI